MNQQDPKTKNELGWFARLFRRHARLTYWLNDQSYQADICDFQEKSPECIQFSDYITQKTTVVRHREPIVYVLEQVK